MDSSPSDVTSPAVSSSPCFCNSCRILYVSPNIPVLSEGFSSSTTNHEIIANTLSNQVILVRAFSLPAFFLNCPSLYS
jgi:hypothetical protein